MRCSRCSEVVDPVVVLDIDGTLGDYHKHFISFALRYTQKKDGFGGPAFAYAGYPEFRVWFCDTFKTSVEEFRRIKLAYRQGSMKRSMPVLPGARELADALERQGAEIWVCTTRPYLSLDNIDPDTRFWLGRLPLAYHGMLFDDDKYMQLNQRIDPERVVMVLDDQADQCHVAERFWPGRVALLGTPYNTLQNFPVVYDSLDVARMLAEQRVMKWRSDHA